MKHLPRDHICKSGSRAVHGIVTIQSREEEPDLARVVMRTATIDGHHSWWVALTDEEAAAVAADLVAHLDRDMKMELIRQLAAQIHEGDVS